MERTVTQDELRKHDGIRGSAWVVHEWVVYDVPRASSGSAGNIRKCTWPDWISQLSSRMRPTVPRR